MTDRREDPRWPEFELTDLSWMADAACADTDRTVFFPPHKSRRVGVDEYAAARRICHTCPVTDDCLEFALLTESRDGMYGGRTPAERAVILRRRRRL